MPSVPPGQVKLTLRSMPAPPAASVLPLCVTVMDCTVWLVVRLRTSSVSCHAPDASRVPVLLLRQVTVTVSPACQPLAGCTANPLGCRSA